jgi:hypothetical protein
MYLPDNIHRNAVECKLIWKKTQVRIILRQLSAIQFMIDQKAPEIHTPLP